MGGTSETAARARLRRSSAVVAMVGAAELGVAAALVDHQSYAEAALGFLAGALPTWAWLCLSLWRRLDDNRRLAGGEAAPLLATLGTPTAITLARGWLISAVAGFLFVPTAGAFAWLPGPLYTAAALLDLVDGALARRLSSATRLGAGLDVTTDATGLFVAPLVAVLGGRLPPWYLLLSAAYPLFRAGLRLRAWAGLPVFPDRLRPDPRARLFAGVQMGCVSAALFPLLPRWLLWPAATVLMLPTLLLFAGEWKLATTVLDGPSGYGASAPTPSRRRVVRRG